MKRLQGCSLRADSCSRPLRLVYDSGKLPPPNHYDAVSDAKTAAQVPLDEWMKIWTMSKMNQELCSAVEYFLFPPVTMGLQLKRVYGNASYGAIGFMDSFSLLFVFRANGRFLFWAGNACRFYGSGFFYVQFFWATTTLFDLFVLK